MALISAVHAYIEKHNLIKSDTKVVVGLSGGPDSVFLLHALARVPNITLIAAHLDHQWRPESAQDAQFCRALCDALKIPLVVATMKDLPPKKYNGSKEDMARHARRTFFETIRAEHGADAIALAHHFDDQIETFFIRLLRGASLTGLTAMRPRHGAYMRPLLTTKKSDIITFLDNNKIGYVIDRTNKSSEFLRNRIRSHVVPALRDCDDRFDSNFLTTMTRLQETEQFLDNLMHHHYATIIQQDGSLSIPLLISQPVTMRYRILMHWLTQAHVPFPPAQAFLDEILRFLSQPGSKNHAICATWKIVKRKHFAWLDRQ